MNRPLFRLTTVAFAPLCAVVLAGFAACSEGPAPEGAGGRGEGGGGRLEVAVVNYPLAYFARRIGGGEVVVDFPAPPGEDPAFWKPGPEEIGVFQGADLILLNGAGYAKWVAQATLPAGRIVDTAASFHDRLIEVVDGVTHQHGPEGEHSHAGTAFTTWLDLRLAAAHAAAVRDALAAARPGEKAGFGERYGALEDELLALDARLEVLGVSAAGRPLIASHPVYQYLARRYGFNLRSLHWEPETVPPESEWTALEGLLAEHPARLMLWEGPPAGGLSSRLGDLGVAGVVFAPCGNVPAGGLDFLAAMEANVSRLEAALGAPAAGSPPGGGAP